MVKRRDGAGGRPFAFIFARMPLHDIVLQVPHPPTHRHTHHCLWRQAWPRRLTFSTALLFSTVNTAL